MHEVWLAPRLHSCVSERSCTGVCMWSWWRTIPNVEQFEGIEQHPFLHVVINLLIGPKARSPIDLPERRGETLKETVFLLHLISFSLSSQLSRHKCFTHYKRWFRASSEKRDLFPHKRKRRAEGRQRGEEGVYFLFQGLFGTFSLFLGIKPVNHPYAYCPHISTDCLRPMR